MLSRVPGWVSRAVVFGGLFRKKSWIEKVNIEELEREKIRLENQIHLIAREIERLEREKKELFRQGVGKSDIEKMLLAEKIKDLDADIKMKLKEYNKLMKQRRAIVNLIRLKQWEKKLKEKGIWDKLRNIEPEKLVAMLSEVEFQEEQFDKNIDKINEILGRQYARIEVDEATREIMELWSRVERAELTPEQAEEKLTTKVAEAEEEKEKEAEA